MLKRAVQAMARRFGVEIQRITPRQERTRVDAVDDTERRALLTALESFARRHPGRGP